MGVKVKLTVPRTGRDGAYDKGEEIEVSAAEAKRLVKAGQAVEVETTAAGGGAS